MSKRFAVCLCAILLIVGFLVPAFLSGWGRGSTSHYDYGWPVFFQIELSPQMVGNTLYRDYRSAGTTPMFFLYLLFPLSIGFLAGLVWPRRSRQP